MNSCFPLKLLLCKRVCFAAFTTAETDPKGVHLIPIGNRDWVAGNILFLSNCHCGTLILSGDDFLFMDSLPKVLFVCQLIVFMFITFFSLVSSNKFLNVFCIQGAALHISIFCSGRLEK